ncbi:HNH endonuclease [Cytobacillus firmus]|uniref:HNH endonuclease n=1 Tax=Cytobacillus firmus TaxID=1399 RepID=UPI00202DB78B|nr:HNH endonuclease [Cytobacillus firmus]URT70940.1 hypothetical protein NAF01_24715 [Cytobacillus firmus]
MSIGEKDIKKLWGLAAGRCSFPTCGVDCIPYLDEDSPTIIGEMAHIIAKKPGGPRGVPGGGKDSYENLILLCPTHHTIIDKAPAGVYPVELIKEWKRKHEEKVNNFMCTIRYSSINDVAKAIKRILIKNQKVWEEFGPESNRAKENPLSNISNYWDLIKLSVIVPNNKKIISLIEAHEDIFEFDEYAVCVDFIVHAELFEKSCYTVIENTKRFPQKFTEVIDRYVYEK